MLVLKSAEKCAHFVGSSRQTDPVKAKGRKDHGDVILQLTTEVSLLFIDVVDVVYCRFHIEFF